ncbi:hypothetical protein EVAR_69925_1 [Eumeta japonica]|uniref:Uncharacterized protein n=1 Tax=Eumeta variegata TaxID=151549 RepID=A0A4C1T928_EUMVA|nr:hypothetical protein EVAR_69925_1 [Eumeta japonica]
MDNLPPPVFDVHCSEERKKAKQVLTISTSPPNHENIISRINHRNSFKTLQHTIGYILRFITNSKFCRTTNRVLDAHEMEEAMNIIIKIVQAAVFVEELERLSLKTPVHKSSPLASLNPFLDECQIMRVGGRLEQSTLPGKTSSNFTTTTPSWDY